MRRGLTLVSLALAFLLPTTAFAQIRERIKISNVRIGFPYAAGAGSRAGLFKAGQWAPIYVDLECVRELDPDDTKLQLIVETRDADDAITEGSVEIATMQKDEVRNANEMGRIPYLKPGSPYASTVAVKVKGVQTGKTYGELSDRTFSGIDTPTYIFLGVGTNLVGLRDDTGWLHTGQVLDIGLLPDQWIGYGAIDMVVVGTGADKSFWEAIAAPQHESRRKALVEWVRRGGRLVVSVGSNPDLLEAITEIKDILPATVPPDGKRSVSHVSFNWVGSGTINERNGTIGQPASPNQFPVNTLVPRPGRATKAILNEDVAGAKPLAIQGSHGLGRVTLVAFDLDRSPFTDWNKKTQFWINLINQSGHGLPPIDKKIEKYSSLQYDDLTGRLQGSLDFFEGVPVVSFGWVALFILIYIILIGPVDYLFLKKVVRRLEWTWVTFPVIVISVSAAAYFAAYALKGKDLKINKVDVVDIDLAGKQVQGNTWFTLFSPRIHNYTIAVEPAGPIDGEPATWTPANPTDATRDTVISWQAHVEQNKFGSSGGGLFSKRYKYQSGTDPVDVNRELYASGLEGVPIQVWTTKAFHAEWSAPIDPENPPIAAELRSTGDDVLVGKLTNNLPVEQFTDVALLWRGKAFIFDNVFPQGSTKSISVSDKGGPAGTLEDAKSWLNGPNRYPPSVPTWSPPRTKNYSYSTEVGTTSNPHFRLWPILFADHVISESDRDVTPNASLRRLDQSWRISIDHPEQAVLVLRMATTEGLAEDISRSGISPSRLWLDKLPSPGAKRPKIDGTLKQETYIRVLIPVTASKK
jgi:hypothetical protein